MDTSKIITNQKEVGPCHYTIEISVPSAEVKSTTTRVEKKYANSIQVPGFRVGKIPSNLIKKRFSTNIKEEVKNELIKAGLEIALSRCNAEPVTMPTFLDGKNFEFNEGSEFSFVVEFEVAPKFDLPDYKGIPLSSAKRSVKEEDILRVLEDLRKQRPSYEKVERASIKSDLLRVSYHVDGMEIDAVPENVRQLFQNEETWLTLGEPEVIPGIIKGLQGVSAGDKVPLQVNFPNDIQESFLAGKSFDYLFTIHEINGCILPELNDEFAQLFSMESLDEMKSSIKNKLQAQIAIDLTASLQKQVYDSLLEKTEFSLPPKLLEAEKQYVSYSVAEEWLKMGKSLEELQKEKDEFDRTVEKQAMKRLKLLYIVSEIARKENIEVSEKEIEKHLEPIYERMVKNSKKNSKKPDKKALKSNIGRTILMDKVANKLIQFAKIAVSNT